jgi:hypothetical protein
MRYYAVKIDGAPSSFPAITGAALSGAQFSSVAMGQNDPGALRCQMYLEQDTAHTASSNSFIRFWGIPLAQISQASNLAGKGIEVDGGMWPGLPLATSQSAYKGMLVQGTIYAAFGNWQGTDMTLDILFTGGKATSQSGGSGNGASTGTPLGQGGIGHQSVLPQSRLLTRKISPPNVTVASQPLSPSPIPMDFFGGGITSAISSLEGILSSIASSFGGGGWAKKPVNLTYNLQPNTLLSSAIQQTLQKAYPNATIQINISPSLKLGYQDAGVYQNLMQFATYMRQLSFSIMGTTNYSGIRMWTQGSTIHVGDGTQQNSSGAIALNYQDLIGQPTWIDVDIIQIKTVMRSDLVIGKQVTLPQGIPVTSTSQAALPLSSTALSYAQSFPLTFTGTFLIQDTVKHIGDSRHPDGAQWCTIIECAGQPGSQDSAGNFGLPAGSPSNVTGPHIQRLAQRKARNYVRSTH